MKKGMFFVLLFLIISSAIAFEASVYLPLELGNSWTYIDSVDGVEESFIEEIVAEETIDGFDVFHANNIGSDGSYESTYIVKTEGVHYTAPLLHFMGIDEDYELFYLPTTFGLGDTWNVFSLDTNLVVSGFPVAAHIELNAEVKPLVDVTVPAGTFND